MGFHRAYSKTLTVGYDGDAEASIGVSPGVVRGIQVKYEDDSYGGSDVEIVNELAGVVRPLLTLTNQSTDFPLQPVVRVVVDETGSDTTEYAAPTVNGHIEITVTEAEPDSKITVTVVVEH
jgi:hypothetical protein